MSDTRGAGTGVYLNSCIHTAGTVTSRSDRHRLAHGESRVVDEALYVGAKLRDVGRGREYHVA